MGRKQRSPLQVACERRNPDLDPQLVWRGKDMQDRSELTVEAPPLFIQEKVHPKALIDDLARRSRRTAYPPLRRQLRLHPRQLQLRHRRSRSAHRLRRMRRNRLVAIRPGHARLGAAGAPSAHCLGRLDQLLRPPANIAASTNHLTKQGHRSYSRCRPDI